jgi:putative ABC transport system permease protein
MLNIIALALVAIAAAGIANTILMAAYERVREIGALRAMGMTRLGVLGLFVGEGLLTGLAGSLAGAAIGGWLVYKYSRDGIDLTGLVATVGSKGVYNSIPFSAMLYTSFSWAIVLGAAAFGLMVAVLSSIYPAVLASRLLPAEAVRAD